MASLMLSSSRMLAVAGGKAPEVDEAAGREEATTVGRAGSPRPPWSLPPPPPTDDPSMTDNSAIKKAYAPLVYERL